MDKNIKPLYDRVLVKRTEDETATASGIIIPDSAKEKTQMGIVISVGDGRIDAEGRRRPLTVKVNDKVIFGKFAGTEIQFNDEEYLIIREDEILGIVE